MRRLLTICFLIFSLPSLAAVKVVYPPPESENDTRFSDLIEILEMALKKTEDKYGGFELMPYKTVMREIRYIEELKKGGSVNVIWSSTSPDKERELLPIRIPLRKGILGYRVSLINKSNQAKIDQLNTLADLQKVTIGQGTGWGDVVIYEANNIKVRTASYESLFKMLNADRFDLFPRGINEAFAEYEARKDENKNIAIEQKLLIVYPWPYYFFTNQNDTQLADRLREGLDTMMADGSFDDIFNKYSGDAVSKANIANRRIIKITNPMLPPETPVDDERLWFKP
ncbi:substrate-binding periplasmic protein [Zooshikella sp. RANM57]|uniref:substrate-binding periplasmic protein n=1 Tax=Zooshikella sp. RANM57 TaxID=3425863 RepID=UPI003D6EC3D3